MTSQRHETSAGTMALAGDASKEDAQLVGATVEDRLQNDQLQNDRLQNVLRWLQTAKENLPDLNNGGVPADRMTSLSALVDRMHRLALEAASSATSAGRRRRAA